MAPQKLWSSERLIPSHVERITSKLDELVQDMKMKDLNLELQKIVDRNLQKGMCIREQNDNAISGHDMKYRYNSNVILSRNNLLDVESKSPSSDMTIFYENGKKGLKVNNEQTNNQQDISSSNPIEVSLGFHDMKLQNQKEASHVFICETLILDHPYALFPGQTHSSSTFEDDDIDIGSDCSPLPEETYQHCHNLSTGCNCMKLRINEEVSAITQDLHKKFVNCCNLPSPSSSASSLATDIASTSSHSLFSGDENGDIYTGISSPESEFCEPTSTHPRKPALKKEFRSASLGSLNSSNLELEKFLRNRDHTSNKRHDLGTLSNPHFTNSSLSSTSIFQNLHSLLPSPTLDWDRSEVDSETQDDSSDARTPIRMSPDFTNRVTDWLHPIFHDHDYAKDTESISSADDLGKSESFSISYGLGKCRKGKKKNTIKNKLDGTRSEKIMKAKYLKKELLRKDSFIKSASDLELVSGDPTAIKTNPVGRPRKRPIDKMVDEEIDPETGTKLKITGKFQDQYVYYLSKSSRTTTRGRQTSPLTPDLNIPTSNPGDIVISHLTDEDVEAVRLQGRRALNLPERPYLTSFSSHPPPLQSAIPPLNHCGEFVSDVDSHIVSTILSMENDCISSAITTESSNIINTAGLNPNQPALTESLRLMSGDSSITSEHVLNYLLSMVKDDGFFGNGRGFDSNGSAMFSSLHLDSTNTKSGSTEEPEDAVDLSSLDTHPTQSLSSGQDFFDFTKSVQGTSLSNSQTLLSNGHETDKHSHNHKDFMNESICLPDDLSSFISESRGTLSTNINEDSQSSMKNMFESELNSLEVPHMSPSSHRLTSIAKTLDYLGVRDDDISVFDTKINHNVDTSQTLAQVSNTFVDDTPWIVTVTLYFNDVPAIMIKNQPYIRLVDIHKQILPAKDTGILKKRCQLLKIPVLCCTEMQRYFLVQYGRAYNSKSTLVVSKCHATDLVTYYATPQPRMTRTIEVHHSRTGKSGRPQNMRLPVAHLLSGRSKRNGSKVSKSASDSLSLSASKALEDSLTQLPHRDTLQTCEAVTTSHDKRTRHKRIHYLNLLKGENKESLFDASISDTIDSVAKSASDHQNLEKSAKIPLTKMVKDTLPSSNMNDIGNIKFASIRMKKNSGIRSQVIQKVKRKKSKKRKGSQNLEQAVDVCSEVDYDDSNDLSQNKKCRPLKLKVKRLFNFSRQRKGFSPGEEDPVYYTTSTVSTTAGRPLRVLAVAHQTSISDGSAESHLPSQPANIHLDLFVKSNSACVCCATCRQFLSVPNFMQHHHVPMGSAWLAAEAAQRVLVPQNKENISQQEQKLWAEFHNLQEAIGGFGEADDETDSDGSEDSNSEDCCSLDLSGCDDVGKKLPATSTISLLSVERSSQRMGDHVTEQSDSGLSSMFSGSPLVSGSNESHNCNKPPASCYPPTSEKKKLSGKFLAKTGLVPQSIHNGGFSDAELLLTASNPSTPNTRTSTRKRKSKQLFSIENYYTPKRWVFGEELSSKKPVQI